MKSKFKSLSLSNGDVYRVSVLLVRVVTLFLLLINVFSVVWIMSHERFYLTNDNPVEVDNPLYNYPKEKAVPQYLRDMPSLPPYSSYGYDLPMIFQMMPFFSFMFLLGSALFNDRKFNKGVLF